MTHTEDDQADNTTRSDQKLRDLLIIRNYLRDRVDELVAAGILLGADVVATEVSRLNKLIAKAEAEATQ